MNRSLTICIVTGRPKPELEWVFDSFYSQVVGRAELMSIDLNCVFPETRKYRNQSISIHPPKPNIWNGDYKVTKEDCWAKSSALNTALCLCKTEWILFVDDRSVLKAGLFDAISDAMKNDWVVSGTYQKRTGMTIQAGKIIDAGTVTGNDDRLKHVAENKILTPYSCPGGWFYGCVNLIKLDTALLLNGWPEDCDGMSFEDCIMGIIVKNAGYELRYDPRLGIIQDRTVGMTGKSINRSAKQRFPNDQHDKAHTMLKRAEKMKSSENKYDLRSLRNHIQAGGQFPVPDPNKIYTDWFDGAKINGIKGDETYESKS